MTDEDNQLNISRRQTLATVGTIGAAGALGGAATNALLWDEEKFGDAMDPNVLQAGALDLQVDWDVRYYDGRDFTDEQIAHSELTDQPGPIIDLVDVKPGDVLEATLSAHVFDNPAFLGWHYQEHVDSDNGINEPEDKVNGHSPDDSDGDPFAAGFGLGVGGLLAGAVPENILEGEDDDEGGLSRKNVLRTAGAVTAGAAGLGAVAGTASAAIGDELGVVELEGQQAGNDGPEGFTCSVGGTFDGTYYSTTDDTGSCGSGVLQIYDPPTSGDGTATLEAEKDIVDSNGNSISDITALFWDPSRSQYWGAQGGGNMYLIDRGDPTDGSQDAVATLEFTATEQYANGGIIDGLARDDDDDTLWISEDVADGLEHYEPAGTHIGTLEPETDSDGNQGGNISGVAIGAPIDGRKTLYLGRAGFGEIVRVYADDGEFISKFAQNVSERVEDLACDPVTYETSAILAKDAYNGHYTALEVEDGTCPLSGGAGEEPEPGDDGELDDVMQCVVWYDDGNNIPEEIWEGQTQLGDPGPEESLDETTQDEFVSEVRHAQSPDDIVDTSAAIFAGTLADMDGADVRFKADDSVAGEPADGDPAEEPDFGGTNGTWCYMNSTTEYIGVLCWVPTDIPGVNDNVTQTDRLEFQFGFDAIQCRHNVEEDGTPIDGTIDDADAENNANTP